MSINISYSQPVYTDQNADDEVTAIMANADIKKVPEGKNGLRVYIEEASPANVSAATTPVFNAGDTVESDADVVESDDEEGNFDYEGKTLACLEGLLQWKIRTTKNLPEGERLRILNDLAERILAETGDE